VLLLSFFILQPTNGLSSLMAAYSNSVLTCTFDRTITNSDNQVFDLSNDYYILYAKGSGGKYYIYHLFYGLCWIVNQLSLTTLPCHPLRVE
jgi:hypothetical protein